MMLHCTVALLRMHIYYILLEHVTYSIGWPRNLLAYSPSLQQHMWRQEAKNRIYCLLDDDSDSIFSWIKLLSYLQTTTWKCPLSPVFLYSLSKKLEFVPVAGAITAVHSDRLILASYIRWPEIQPSVSRGQIVSADLPLLTDRQTDGQTDRQI